jgi:hypothetical protein
MSEPTIHASRARRTHMHAKENAVATVPIAPTRSPHTATGPVPDGATILESRER